MEERLMTKTIALVACGALLFGAASCKKDKKDNSGEKPADPTAGKTTEQPVETPTEPAKPKLDTAEDKVAFYRACYDHLNAKDWDKFGPCFTDDAVAELVDSGEPAASGRAAIVDRLKTWATAFPDFQVTPTLILASGNKIASVHVFTGTNTGPMTSAQGEMPATNKKVGMTELHIVEIDPAAGGASKEWLFSDMGTFMGQLGVHQMPHRAAVEKPTGEPQIVIAKDDETEKANLELHKKSMEAWEKKDAKAMAAFTDDKAVMHDYASPADTDKKKSMAMMQEIIKAFPDAKSETVDVWAAGEYIVSVSKNTGTNKGPMKSMGLKKPTGKSMSFTGADIAKVQNGKVVESWSFYNGVAIATQLGLMPAPGSAGDAKAGDPAAGDAKGADPKGHEGHEMKDTKKGGEKPAEPAPE
jgi:predicted ester cyclase